MNSPTDDCNTCAPPVCSTNEDSNAGASNVPGHLERATDCLRKQLSKKFAHTTALVEIELCTGLTDQTITSIAANFLNIHCENDVLEYDITSSVYCSAIFNPHRTCAVRVTVVGLCVCVCVCLSVHGYGAAYEQYKRLQNSEIVKTSE